MKKLIDKLSTIVLVLMLVLYFVALSVNCSTGMIGFNCGWA